MTVPKVARPGWVFHPWIDGLGHRCMSGIASHFVQAGCTGVTGTSLVGVGIKVGAAWNSSINRDYSKLTCNLVKPNSLFGCEDCPNDTIGIEFGDISGNIDRFQQYSRYWQLVTWLFSEKKLFFVQPMDNNSPYSQYKGRGWHCPRRHVSSITVMLLNSGFAMRLFEFRAIEIWKRNQSMIERTA